MRKLHVIVAVVALMAVLFTVQAPIATAATVCTTDWGAQLTGAVAGPVIVPAGHSCQISNAIVNGSVWAKAGNLGLRIFNSTIKGSVSSDGAQGELNAICPSTITGNVNVSRSAVPFAINDCYTSSQGNTIGGNVALTNNTGSIDFNSNQVSGSVNVTGNTGGITILGNSITGPLNCLNNNPPPASGGLCPQGGNLRPLRVRRKPDARRRPRL